MGYLEYHKEELINLNRSLKKEYVRTNRADTYACSTIINCNTRKYHGLLICPIKDLGNGHFVLLSALDETITHEGQSFNLGIHQYQNEFNPLGHKYIKSFNGDIIPTITYRVGNIILQKEFLLVEDEERALVKYTVLESQGSFTFSIKPFLAFRNIHELTYANHSANGRSTSIEKGVKVKMYEGFPFLNMQLNKANEFIPAPDWYYGVCYEKEKIRSDFYTEDLMVPGYFEIELKEGDSLIFSAGTSEIKTSVLAKKFETEKKKKIVKSSFEECLKASAKQFIIRKNGKTEIVAGYPWFGNWGRDSLVALPGLTLAFGDVKTYKDILTSISENVSGYIYTNQGNIDHSESESIDTPLWFIHAVQNLLPHSSKVAIKKDFGKKIEEILEDISLGKNQNIYPHDNGMLFMPDPNKALTWMESNIHGTPVVKRYGYAVEINCLWYNAICFYLELFGEKGNEKWVEIKDKIKTNFIPIFWNKEKEYLADFHYNGYSDFTIRPNQVFATCLPYSPLEDIQKRKILELIQANLLTDKGLRSLSPSDSNFLGTCEGDKFHRASAYHQGAVWPWLLAPFAAGYLKINGKAGLSLIKRLYRGFESEIHNHGIGSISEIYDGNPPHQSRGAVSQAWSVGAILQLKMLIDEHDI